MSLKIKNAIIQYVIAMGCKYTEAQIEVTTKVVYEKFGEEKVLEALNKMLEYHSFFPTIADISKAIKGDEKAENKSIAMELATKVMHLAATTMKTDFSVAKAELGQEMFSHIDEFQNGFKWLSDQPSSDSTNLTAQLRDYIHATVKNGKLIQRKFNGEKFIEQEKKSGANQVDFNKFLPDNS